MINYSVVLPFRDKYELFLKAVESIPDRDDIQIIIVDNAIQNLTVSQIPKKNNAKLTYVTSSPLKGAGCARNQGLKHIEGKYTLFIDADDFFTDEAFRVFDKYLNNDYDITFFKPTSIRLSDGNISTRHEVFVKYINDFINNKEENYLRYKWEVPWAKMFRSEFVLQGGFLFEELRVNNDAWFSMMTGHAAKKIQADTSIVYVVTEGESGTSLTKKNTKENWFIRYQVAVRINKFLKTVGKYKYRTRLLGFLKVALKEFGIKEFFHFLRYAFNKKVSVF